MNAGTGGEDINISKEVFYGWIIDYYLHKGAKFFITYGNEYLIFPTENIRQYFNVSARYRVKRSGSRNPAQGDNLDILRVLGDTNAAIRRNEKYTEVITRSLTSDTRIRGVSSEYYFKKISDGLFRVTKLSNTANANVIFSINLQLKTQLEPDLNAFLKVLDII